MLEQNKAATDRGWQSPTCTRRASCRVWEGSAQAWHTWASSASFCLRICPTLPSQRCSSSPPGTELPPARLHQPGSTEDTGSAHGDTEIHQLCQEKERGGRRRAELHCRTCFSSQITWRCSQISAYIGFSLFLFLFPKHSPLLYGKERKKYMNAFTCWYNLPNCPPG